MYIVIQFQRFRAPADCRAGLEEAAINSRRDVMVFAIVSTVQTRRTATLLYVDRIEMVSCAAIGGVYPVL